MRLVKANLELLIHNDMHESERIITLWTEIQQARAIITKSKKKVTKLSISNLKAKSAALSLLLRILLARSSSR